MKKALIVVFFSALAISGARQGAFAAICKKPKRVKTRSEADRCPSASIEAPGLVDLKASVYPELRDGVLRPLSVECKSGSPDQICIGLKYVVFRDASGKASLQLQEAAENVRAANRIWKKCGISFQIDKFAAVDPTGHHIQYNLADYRDLTAVRRAYGESDKLLVAATGAWNRKGSLGDSTANAWTSLPPAHPAKPQDGPFGAVIEAPVASNGHLVAHELGHYLNLLHTNQETSVMNPVIYRRSVEISADECSLARETARTAWVATLR